MALSETVRLKRMFAYEHQARSEGYKWIAGIDEAGRGPLAGPVVSACCILPEKIKLENLNDSKQLTAEERDLLFSQITNHPDIYYGISIIDVETIDTINILQATLLGMRKSVAMLQKEPDYLLVDGNTLPYFSIQAKAIVDGDALSASIASASIIAKVTRDRLMQYLDRQYPMYGFARHKGYATAQHMQAIKEFGPSPIHRKSFEPVKSILSLPLTQIELF